MTMWTQGLTLQAALTNPNVAGPHTVAEQATAPSTGEVPGSRAANALLRNSGAIAGAVHARYRESA